MNRLAVEWLIVAALALTALFRRKKIRLLPSVLVTAGVTFFSLFTPSGKVLLYVYGKALTEGALFEGLHKSAVLVGMVFLSQCIVSKRIRLPGKAGAFLQQMFADFETLTTRRLEFKKGHFIESLDERLSAVYPLEAPAPSVSTEIPEPGLPQSVEERDE